MNNHHGIVLERVRPGGWLRSLQPGNFADLESGLIIPGPKVRVEQRGGQRVVVEITELPAPVRVPTHRVVRKAVDPKRQPGVFEYAEAPFDAADENGGLLTQCLNLALASRTIAHVSDAVMAETYPELWAQRNERLVFDPFGAEQRERTSFTELIAAFEGSDEHRKQIAAVQNGELGFAEVRIGK